MHNFFQKLINLDQNLLTIILITVFYTVEQIFKTPHQFKKRGIHLLNNFVFEILFVIVFFFVASFQVWSIRELNSYHLGLFYFLKIPYVAKVIIGVACFDLFAYWTHCLSHKVPLIWRLHRVHHSDTTMDSSTYFRGHPLELTFAATNIIGAFVFGLDINILTLYFLILLPFQIAEHSNIEFPEWLNNTVGFIFTTPNMHKIHHHKDQEYTDSNYADIFIIWDRLFGTYTYVPVKQIPYGLDEFDDKKKQTFWYLIKSPFLKMDRISGASETRVIVMKFSDGKTENNKNQHVNRDR
ncbi:MAG TPA: sterol desaturase family protein [Hanamia sp.]|nr:sterol desaturase family protein [Hanamia sp.]